MRRRVLRMAELAFQISSMKARWASGRRPAVTRRKRSSFRAAREIGPKTS
jgi:hypothetical protein